MRISDWSSDVCSSDLQLLEGERGRVGVNGGDRSGVAAVDVAKIEESRAIAQFLQQDAIGPHTQAGLDQMLGPDLGLPLSVLGIEKMDGVAVGAEQFEIGRAACRASVCQSV